MQRLSDGSSTKNDYRHLVSNSRVCFDALVCRWFARLRSPVHAWRKLGGQNKQRRVLTGGVVALRYDGGSAVMYVRMLALSDCIDGSVVPRLTLTL